jgi:malonate transporter
VNHVLPVFAVIGLGALLRLLGLASDQFFRTSERVVYYICFPALLFLKISTPVQGVVLPAGLFPAVLLALFTCFAASLLYARLAGLPAFKVGSFSQATYRFNTYVGMAIVISSLGQAGAAAFGLLISLAIPFINLMAVSSLIWYSAGTYSSAKKLNLAAKALVLNPLILACLAGLAYGRWLPPLPVFLQNSLNLLAMLSLPLALIAIGGALSLGGLAGHLRLSLVASLFKQGLLPLLGFAMLRAWGVGGPAFKVAMIFFALPTATSSYILSSQLGSDTDLAAATIVLSTLISFFSLSAVLTLF